MDAEEFLEKLGLAGRLKSGLLIAGVAFLAGVAVASWRDAGTLNQKDAALSQKDATIGQKMQIFRALRSRSTATRINSMEPRQKRRKEKSQIWRRVSQD
jgi:hypothetical protein